MAKRGASNDCGLHGSLYQIHLTTLFIANSIKNPTSNFTISVEDDDGGKFDDIIFKAEFANIPLQAKHSKSISKKITHVELFGTNAKKNAFSLPKYFLSYLDMREKLKPKYIIISTNKDICETLKELFEIKKLEEDHLLYHSGGPEYYKLTNKGFEILKNKAQEYNKLNNIRQNDEEFTIDDKDVVEFSDKLQLVCNYPRGKQKLEMIVSERISMLKELSKGLDIESTTDILFKKIGDWFQSRNRSPITTSYVKAMFAEVRSLSMEEKLKSFNLNFTPKNISYDNQIIHVVPQKDYLLTLIKVYNDLKVDNNQILIVDPDLPMAIKITIINAFDFAKYTHLLITKITDSVEYIYTNLTAILDKYSYKKIILITEPYTLTEKFSLSNKEKYTQTDLDIGFKDLSNEIQSRLIYTNSLILQGRRTNLSELIDDNVETIVKEIDNSILFDLAKKEDIPIGNKFDQPPPFYITRNLKRGQESFPETHIISQQTNGIANVLYISDLPGAGKSTFLSSIASQILSETSNIWVIRINLNTYTNIFYEYKVKGKDSIELHSLLNSKSSTQLRSNFEEALLYGVHKKIALIIDGVDDVIPDYTDIIVNLIIKSSKSTNIWRIFVASRTYVQEIIEKKLNVESFHLEQLSDEEQVDFLVGFWSNNLHINNNDGVNKIKLYAQKLLGKLLILNDPGYTRFLGVPLQIFMLAEIFQSRSINQRIAWHTCEDYLNSNGRNALFPENLNLSTLYDLFIERKRDIYIMDTCKSDGNIEMMKYLSSKFDEYLQDHQNLATTIIFKEKSKQISKDAAESLLKIGIVQKFSSRFTFIHKTFAEYFTSKYLFEKLKQQQSEIASWVHYHFGIIPKDQTITIFFNELIESECFNILDDLDMQKKILETMKFSNKTPLLEKVSMLKMLQHKGWNQLHIAAMMNDLRTLKSLVERGAEINVVSYKGQTAWHYSAIHGNVEMLKFLHEVDCDINARTDDGELVSHILSYNGHLDGLLYVLENGIPINDVNIHGDSHLHIAARGGHLHIIEAIIKKEAFIEIRNKNGETPYHLAAKYGKLKVLQYFLNIGFDINVLTNKNETALHLAVENDHLNIAEYLILQDINLDTNNKALLESAAQYGRLDILTLLVEKNINIDINTYAGLDILRKAITHSQRHIVEYILDYNKIEHNVEYKYNVLVIPSYEDSVGVLKMVKCILERIQIEDRAVNKSLSKVIRDGHLEVVKYLLNYRNEPVSYYMEELICTAAYYGHLEILKYLEDEGASLFSQYELSETLRELTVLQHAALGGHFSIVEYLIDKGVLEADSLMYGGEVFHLAAAGGHFDVVSLLLSNGTDIDHLSKEGKSALHYAAIKGSTNVVMFLIEKGININGVSMKMNEFRSYDNLLASISENVEQRVLFLMVCQRDGSDYLKHWTNKLLSDNGMSALHFASYYGHIQVVKCLVKHNIDIFCKSQNGMNAMHFAAAAGHLDVMDYLANRAVSLRVVNKNNWTPLHFASLGGNLEVVQYLINKNVPMDTKSDSGLSVLHFAVCSGSLDVVEYLVDRGLSCVDKTNSMWLPIHFAAREGFKEIVQFLLSKNIDINAKTDKGLNIIHIASQNGHLKLEKYLENMLHRK